MERRPTLSDHKSGDLRLVLDVVAKSVCEKGVVGLSQSEKPQGREAEAADAPECIVDGSRQSYGLCSRAEPSLFSHMLWRTHRT